MFLLKNTDWQQKVPCSWHREWEHIPWPSSKNSVIVAEVHLDQGLEASMLVRMEDIRRLSSMEPKFSSQNLESSWERPSKCPVGMNQINKIIWLSRVYQLEFTVMWGKGTVLFIFANNWLLTVFPNHLQQKKLWKCSATVEKGATPF